MIQDQHTKIIVLLYISNEQSEIETKKTIPFTIASKKNKIRVNLTKVQALYTENYRTLLNVKIVHVHGQKNLTLLKKQYSSN